MSHETVATPQPLSNRIALPLIALLAAAGLVLAAPLSAKAVSFAEPLPDATYANEDLVTVHLADLVSTGLYRVGICVNIDSQMPLCDTELGHFATVDTDSATAEASFTVAKKFETWHGGNATVNCKADADADGDQCYIVVMDHTWTDPSPLSYQPVFITE